MIEGDLRKQLEAATFQAVGPTKRKELARAAFRSLGSGRFDEPRLVKCGPAKARRTVATAVDRVSGVDFALVPGGTMRFGLDDAHWSKFVDIAMSLASPMQPYGVSSTVGQARGTGEDVVLDPFLVARFPITARVAGLDDILSTDRIQRNFRKSDLENGRRFLPLLIDEVRVAEAKLGVSMPTVFELDWAITAGARSVFYWGNTLDYAAMSERGPEHPLLRQEDAGFVPWPATTAFGLRAAVSIPQWCSFPLPTAHGAARHDDESELLLVRGGAGYYAPWQGAGEFLWLVSFMNARADAFEAYRDKHAFRPVIRLAGR